VAIGQAGEAFIACKTKLISISNQRIESTPALRFITPMKAPLAGSQAHGGGPFIARWRSPVRGRTGNIT